MNITRSINYSDLNFETQQSLIGQVSDLILREAEDEGKQFVNRPEHQGKTWERAYCEEYAISHIMWSDLSDEDLKTFKFDLELRNWAEEEAQKRLESSIRNIPVEIPIK